MIILYYAILKVAREKAGVAKRKAEEKALFEAVTHDVVTRFFNHLDLNALVEEIAPHGKPRFSDGIPLFFNRSDAGDYWICAFSDKEVGVDIEPYRTARMEVAKRFFQREEVASLEALSGESRDRLFFDYWSIKESYLKYTGVGLSDIEHVKVALNPEGICLYDRKETPIDVAVHRCLVHADYACFVCSAASDEVYLQEFIL